MHLYIKTPLYENNKYVPHLLEHCVLFSADREELFSYFVDIEAYTAYGHTCFEFSKPLVIANIVDKIRKPISKESYLFQKKVIANEIKEISNDKKWREKAYQYLIKNPEIRTNNIPKGVSLATLHDYQQLRYQEKNMIFVWDDDTIDLTFWKAKSLKKLTGKRDKKGIQFLSFTYQKETEDLLFCKYKSASDILFLDFFEGLITDFLFLKTTQNKEFFADTISLTISDEIFCLSSYDTNYPKEIDSDFFDFYKQRHLKKISYNQLRGFLPEIALYTGEYATISEHQNFIQTITYADIQSILDTISTQWSSVS